MARKRKLGYTPFKNPTCERARKNGIEECVDHMGRGGKVSDKVRSACGMGAGMALERVGCKFEDPMERIRKMMSGRGRKRRR